MADNRDDDELSIPRASLNKMIKEIIPNVRVANDARELILNCCTEFIHLVSTEANDICNKQLKKTISPEHVLAALDSLGFGSYKEDATTVLKEAKAVAAKKRRGSSRLENLGIPEEELLRQQQELFAQAKFQLDPANDKKQEPAHQSTKSKRYEKIIKDLPIKKARQQQAELEQQQWQQMQQALQQQQQHQQQQQQQPPQQSNGDNDDDDYS